MKSAMTTIFRTMRTEFAATYRAYYRGYCISSAEEINDTQKSKHPYRKLHPWKSEKEFVNDILRNVIYNADGIVAINKPYGIAVRNKSLLDHEPQKICHHIANAVNYTLEDILPDLAKELNVPALVPCIGAEKYMSGIYLYGINKNACEELATAQRRASQMQQFKKYWVITTRVPNILKGQYHLAMKLEEGPKRQKKPVIVTKWSNNAEKRRDIKILNIKYKLISNSTQNLCSLIELETSTKKWHAIRLFAAIMLYSPVLGDNYHGSRVQELMGTWMKVNPFAETCNDMPFVNRELLNLLNLKKKEQEIIPCHTHLKSVFLKFYGRNKKDILIEAPLMHPFDWTCQQLMFKNVPCDVDNSTVESEAEATCV